MAKKLDERYKEEAIRQRIIERLNRSSSVEVNPILEALRESVRRKGIKTPILRG